MIDLELSPVASRIVDELTEVNPSEEVLVISDPKTTSIGRAIATAARGSGATATLSIMPLLDAHGNEPPATIASAMKAADVAVTATTHAITHTQSRLDASEAGTRVVVLRGVTEEMMIEGGMNTDFSELAEVTAAVRDVLDNANHAHITSQAGTDLEVNLQGSAAFSLDGYFHEYGFSALPPGEAPTCPQKPDTNGSLVIDYSMDNIGHLDEPIKLTIEEGMTTNIEGGNEADQLQDIVDSAGQYAGNLAEFAIGTNPDARLIGNLAEDKKRRGTVHFAIGDDTSLGGERQSDIHLDGLVTNPTVELDETTILDKGTLRTERIRELAGEH